jgi:hypothetical protein
MEAPALAELSAREETSISTLGLVRRLTNDTKQLLRQEIELAKAETSEKISLLTRNSIVIAVGGLIAYAGLMVFLAGVGWLIGWAFQRAGVEPLLAEFIGFAIIGLVVAAIGSLFVMKAIKTFSKDKLTPQRTIHSLQRLKGSDESNANGTMKSAPKRPSKEIEAQMAETENRMSAALDTLGERFSPRHINQQVKHRIQRSPYQSGLLAMAAGLVGGLFLTRGHRSSDDGA